MGDYRAPAEGRLWSVLEWDRLGELWRRVDPAAGWYLLAAGEPVPAQAADGPTVSEFISRIDALLRSEHREAYCGIVYADDLDAPCLIKIYDPNNLGSSCGSSKNPPGPGWIMSRVAPDAALPAATTVPAGRKRWWQALFPDS